MRLDAIQTRLADLWLKHTDAHSYHTITRKIGITPYQLQKKLDLIAEEVNSALQKHNISFIIKKRVKSIYSIWRKIQKLKVNFNQVHDLFAIRVIIQDIGPASLQEEKIICWKILSVLTTLYKPVHTIMRDWVSTPKENGYESLHLIFESHEHGKLEVQIRTQRMDDIAEYGKAAHWKYKWNKG
ncbi:bifunctional (p)ppGpp synthetase/guanosine-3',5'-bis(diphosphate) 3'-pyrophosphohydrolase [Candidatus Cardinium hertigii]|uniref:GTP pyrophosphokinase n=1 Tax=Candidatus Cardinium hertigii TaxID=247481 RepID=A0A2Z3LHA5_9BACT|nr:bifunctional (p)ppGpp synthetase/guanosine-3',5'-bis(diphosphate) 3'-pyrophosphohydrolase [Candidatus Cardinium hertigii]AWN81895.1 GTP pyrophosphokinase [Candidatus Cardinium hertigii]